MSAPIRAAKAPPHACPECGGDGQETCPYRHGRGEGAHGADCAPCASTGRIGECGTRRPSDTAWQDAIAALGACSDAVATLRRELAAAQAREQKLRAGLIHEAAEIVRWACGLDGPQPHVKRGSRAWWDGIVDAIRRAGIRLRDLHDKTRADAAGLGAAIRRARACGPCGCYHYAWECHASGDPPCDCECHESEDEADQLRSGGRP